MSTNTSPPSPQLPTPINIVAPEEIKLIEEVIKNPNPEEEQATLAGANEDDTEVLGENQKGLIMQLLSQLRVGMDLTRVLIPVDFLEPRSMLEKLTDFLTHCDLICSAGDPEDPVERMVQVVRWYLSGWHVKPKGVKKPYNPALGEIFRSNFVLPDGSVLSYFAEQVSHHPPISAIYGENKTKDMAFEGWYYPRSKFYGNSAASVAEGIVKIHFRSRKEIYVATWPDVYARGILFGKLVMELGGKTTISCKQTGMSAEIEFKQKPLFGGEYNIVSAKIKKKGKTTHTITGKWNEKYYVKSKLVKNAKEILFFDCKTGHRNMKHTPLYENQLQNESRKRWYFLSQAIKARDIQNAAKEKSKVEEDQRQKAKEREEKGEIYKPKFFKKGPEDFWTFCGHELPEYQHCFTKLPLDCPACQGPPSVASPKPSPSPQPGTSAEASTTK